MPEARHLSEANDFLVEAHGPSCVELQHFSAGSGPMVELVTTCEGSYVVVHNITGERVALENGPSWKLLQANGWGYIAAANRGARWCSSLLTRSVWRTPSGALFVKQRRSDGAPDLIWMLCEHDQLMVTKYVSWPAAPDITALPPGSRVFVVSQPRSHSSHFWALADFQDAADFCTKHTRSSRWLKASMPAWKELFAKMGLPSDHIVRPFLRGCADENSIQAQTWGVSSHGLVLLLAHWTAKLKTADDRRRAHGLLVGLVRKWSSLTRCYVRTSSMCDLANIPNDGECLIARHGVVSWEGVHARSMTEALGPCASFVDVLVTTAKWRGKRVFSHVVMAIGSAVNEQLGGKPLVSDALKVMKDAPIRSHRRADRARREALACLEGHESRNSFRTAKLARKFGLGAAVHRAWADAAAQRRYLVACRRLFGGCKSFACVPDKSRFSGKEWLGNSLYSADVDTLCWCAPRAR